MEQNFSQQIDELLKGLSREPLTIKRILSNTSERGVSLVIGVLSLPFFLPLPPGLSGILILACFLLAGQMALGRHEPWLPNRLAHFQFPMSLSRKLLNTLKKGMSLLEKLVRPRLLELADNRHVWRMNGFCILWLTVLLCVPIPFTNAIAASGILLLVISTLERDGLLMLFSYFAVALITLCFGLIGYVIWQVPDLIPQIF